MKKQSDYGNFIEKKVLAFIRQQHMLAPGDKVVLGVSGGADSVCLLMVLHALSEELGIRLHVGHVNHGVREEAGEDGVYVEQLCRELGVPFFLKEIRMEELAAEWKCSPEEAGRKARYAFFEEICETVGAEKIAVAHNMGDCSETMLFHLFRGSGLTGLSGIRPVRGKVVRPILCLEREEIEQYLQARKISHCHDITNDGDDYTRNRIRHHILPYAEAEIVRGATRNVYEAAKHIALAQEFIEQQAEGAWKEVLLCQGQQRLELDIPRLLGLHEVLQKEVLRRAIGTMAEGCKDITREHIESLLGLVTGSGNRQVSLPYLLRGERSYERLLLYREKEKKVVLPEACVDVQALALEPWTISVAGAELELKVLDFSGNLQDIPQNKYTKWLDYDKIKSNIKIRHRRIGDYFSVKTREGVGRKKLKDYLMDEKVPRQERDELLLLAEESHVLWLIPYRISEDYKVDHGTKRVLQIIIKGQNGGNYGKAQS
ncbi:MAG: tRNA lysidine(34) synthetase TilS [Lachnospiraceae bacterium]|nr:tRNA lysidine(34) synthetase TilS [Lachnospiraceae bacterium]